MLARWASKGWLSRIRRGLYIPVPLESRTSDVAIQEPWLIAQSLYAPCYIGGWSAAEYWGLTEQIFRSILVFTSKKPLARTPTIKNIKFIARKISEKAMFGLKPVWKGSVKISVSDPSRTIIDMLNDPALGGGIRPTADALIKYLQSSEYKNLQQLIEYAKLLGNGTVYKRLGFLLEQYAPGELDMLAACATNMTKGNSMLDPKLASARLATKWRLWIPENWIKEKSID
jgi:predicted transcriptional regulator of viral defense system